MRNILVTQGENPLNHFLSKLLKDDQIIWGVQQEVKCLDGETQINIPSTDHPNFIHALLNICLDNQINTIIATSAAEVDLLNEASILFTEFDIDFGFPSADTLELLKNQFLMLEQLTAADVPAVPFHMADNFADFSKAILHLGYPASTITFTENAGLSPTWYIRDEGKLNRSNEVHLTFTQAARMIRGDEQQSLLIRKAYADFQEHWVYFKQGYLSSSWLETGSAETLLLNNIGRVLKLNGIYKIQLEDKNLVYQISALHDNLF